MEFRFNALGFVYHSGLSDIRRAFDATMFAIDDMCDGKRLDKLANIELIEAGKIPAAEYDADGFCVFDQLELNDFLIQKADDSANAARSAYVLIMYHYWEKSCARWTKRRGSYEYNSAYKWLEENNVPFDRQGLERMRILAQFIKHENLACYTKYPEFFDTFDTREQRMRMTPSDDLLLTSQHLLEMFDTLERSGYVAT